MADPSMYEVRVHFKNGSLLTYSYRDMGRASEAKDLCATAMLASKDPLKEPRTAANPHAHPWVAPAICRLFDEGGHEAHLDGAEMFAVQMIDLEAESYMNTRAQIVVGRTRDDLLRKAGIIPVDEPRRPNGYVVEDQSREREPASGAIGRFAT